MVKNITFSAEEDLLEKARSKAALQHKSLNEAFREWVRQYAYGGRDSSSNYAGLMKKLANVAAGRKFTRQEMNER